MTKCKAVTYAKHGPPLEVLQVTDRPLPPLQPHEALIHLRVAPINPVDLNVIEGKYPVRSPLPAVGGSEGVGLVAALGENVRDLEIGAKVLVPHEFGSWRKAGVIEAEKLTVVPPEISDEQAAMLNINPPTAWRMLHDFVELQPGDWVMQNAANSGVGMAVIAIAKARGWRTVNVVRREELIPELRTAGADVVLLENEDLPAQIATATDGAPIALALNAVGGDSALRLAKALAPGGTIVTFGAMGRQPLRIPNGLLIFNDQRWRGFWITHWYHTAEKNEVKAMFKQLFPLLTAGVVHSKIERSYPLAEARAAVEHAMQSRRAGKILLRLNA